MENCFWLEGKEVLQSHLANESTRNLPCRGPYGRYIELTMLLEVDVRNASQRWSAASRNIIYGTASHRILRVLLWKPHFRFFESDKVNHWTQRSHPLQPPTGLTRYRGFARRRAEAKRWMGSQWAGLDALCLHSILVGSG
jgi:hypothetical protein